MSGLRWTTAGESHGAALVAILEGFPSGFALDIGRVDAELARRQGGYGRGGRMKLESDSVQVLSGLRAGLTLGSPIALQLLNRDHTIERLPVPTNPRPGHADLGGCLQHEVRDPRAVLERASARETAARTALGAVARQLLEHFGIELCGHVVELGADRAAPAAVEAAFHLPPAERAAARAASPIYSFDPEFDARATQAIEAAKAEGDTLGGVWEVRVLGLPPGLGGYMQGAQRLTSRLAAAVLSIPAMKGVEFGAGFDLARQRGSSAHDPIEGRPAGDGPWGSRYARQSNRAARGHETHLDPAPVPADGGVRDLGGRARNLAAFRYDGGACGLRGGGGGGGVGIGVGVVGAVGRGVVPGGGAGGRGLSCLVEEGLSAPSRGSSGFLHYPLDPQDFFSTLFAPFVEGRPRCAPHRAPRGRREMQANARPLAARVLRALGPGCQRSSIGRAPDL